MKAMIFTMVVLVALSLMLISTVSFAQAGDENRPRLLEDHVLVWNRKCPFPRVTIAWSGMPRCCGTGMFTTGFQISAQLQEAI